MRLYIDLETYSDAPLETVGAYKYAADPSTRIILFGYAIDDAPARTIDIEHGESVPPDVLAMLSDTSVEKWAHNAPFERTLIERVWGIPCPPEQWRCTAVWARIMALPSSLRDAAVELRLDVQKLDPGKRLITQFCTPRGRTQQALLVEQDWADFRTYCERDVEVCRAIAERLADYPVHPDEWDLWALDQRINDTGLPVDMGLLAAVQRILKRHQDRILSEARDHTGLANPRSREQLMGWCRTNGADLPDMTAETVQRFAEDPETPPQVRTALEFRKQLAGTSTAKFAVAEASAHAGRVAGTLLFHGAERTGRWTGKGFQPHNLPRGVLEDVDDLAAARQIVMDGDDDWLRTLYGDDIVGVLSSLVRTVIAAPPGRQLVVADYASIESVMLAWLSGSRYLLDLFRAGRDSYKDFATHLFGIPYEEVTKAQRKNTKPAVLGCGYGLGGPGLQQYAEGFGLKLTEAEAAKQVGAFRSAYPDIPRYWGELTDAVFAAMSERRITQAGALTLVPDLPRFLLIYLPSGRALSYYRPRIEAGDRGDQLTYRGRTPDSRVGTHAGKLVENVVQAISRDVLAHGLKGTARDRGLRIVGHVHDEIICEADPADTGALDRLCTAMSPPPWCHDAPIRAVGWVGPWYRKD